MSHPTDATNANRDDDSIEPNVAIADVDYLRFGWWTKVAADGAVSFQTFFGGNDAFTVGDIGGLEGTVRWLRFFGQSGDPVKVYSVCRSCRQNAFESISFPLLLRLWGCGQGA